MSSAVVAWAEGSSVAGTKVESGVGTSRERGGRVGIFFLVFVLGAGSGSSMRERRGGGDLGWAGVSGLAFAVVREGEAAVVFDSEGFAVAGDFAADLPEEDFPVRADLGLVSMGNWRYARRG